MADPALWDLLDEDCSNISDWADADTGTATSSQIAFDGKSCFKMDVSPATAGDDYASRWRDVGSFSNQFTYEISLYHSDLGAFNNGVAPWRAFIFDCRQADERIQVVFSTDGLKVRDDGGDTEVGTNLVKANGNAGWQIWRFLVTFTGITGNGTCDVYLKDSTHVWVKVGTGIACSLSGTLVDGETYIINYVINDNATALTYIDYIKIATGLYSPCVYCFSGYVFEQNNPVSRKLYLHNRTDGELITTTTSSGNGYYYLETSSSGSHYIVCLDDEAGVEYNDLIIGSAIPTEIT